MTSPVLTVFKRPARLMGSAFEFILTTEENGESFLDDAITEVKRIETLLTEFSETSQTAIINAMAGTNAVDVDQEVFDLVVRGKRITSLTQGAFDLTAGVLKKLYNFKGQSFVLPSAEVIMETLKCVGADNIDLAIPGKIFLKKKGMRISFAAIGKGYAADKVKSMLALKGIQNGVINASGDLTAWGTRPDGSPWKVGIADPNDQTKIILWIPIHNASVATSGDYEQYFERNGIRYSHTIDPKTGRPVTGLKSVTIVSPSAELSDALATAVFVMGVDSGINFIEQLPNVHALVITDKNRIFTTRHLKFNTVKA